MIKDIHAGSTPPLGHHLFERHIFCLAILQGWIASETRTDTLNAVRTVAGTQRANEEPLENNPHDPIGQVSDVLQRTTYQHTDRDTFVRCINPTHYKEYSRNILLNNNE